VCLVVSFLLYALPPPSLPPYPHPSPLFMLKSVARRAAAKRDGGEQPNFRHIGRGECYIEQRGRRVLAHCTPLPLSLVMSGSEQATQLSVDSKMADMYIKSILSLALYIHDMYIEDI
jgi:hypothetical protein